MPTHDDPTIELRAELITKMRRLGDLLTASSGRDLSRRERAEVEKIRTETEAIRARLPEPLSPRLLDNRFTETHMETRPDGPVVLRQGEAFVDYLRDSDPGAFRSGVWDEVLDPTRFSLGRLARGAVTGNWRGAETERRAMLEGTASTGGALLPSPMAGSVIDRLRNAAQVMKAGAVTVPMTENTLLMARLTSGPSPALAWHSEGAQISDSGRTVDKITFTAQTLPNLTLISYELLNDMSDEAARTIENEIVKSMALEIDRACLRGSGTAPEPRGVRNASGVTITSLGSNGAIPTWDNIVDGVSTLRTANVEPNGILWAARTQQTFDKLKQSTGAYLEPPPGIADITRLVTNQIPVNLTQGSSNAASEIYIADWTQLMLGVRQEIGFQILGDGTGPWLGGRVRVLTERYADQGLAGLLSFFRGDVQLAQPSAFNVLTGVTP
jgi:HK97 family phage major capsid protein